MKQQKAVLNLDSMEHNGWSNASGCFLKFPFNEEKRAECESSNPKAIQAETDRIIAEAILEKQRKDSKPTGWTATQTAAVAIGSLLAITLMVIVIKRVKKK